MAILTNSNFEALKSVSVDDRGRLTLGKEAASGGRYRVLKNKEGQILLDPLTEVSEWELRLLRNADAKASLDRGIEQAAAGEIMFTDPFKDNE